VPQEDHYRGGIEKERTQSEKIKSFLLVGNARAEQSSVQKGGPKKPFLGGLYSGATRKEKN